MMRRQKMLSTMKILMKNMMDLKLKQLQRKTTCCQKKITSHHLQGMHWSIIQLQCLMRRITMRMKKHPMIMSLLVIMLFKIFLQVILEHVPNFFHVPLFMLAFITFFAAFWLPFYPCFFSSFYRSNIL